MVYTVVATDTNDNAAVIYSLKDTLDQAFFSIDATSGEVTLTGNPDDETKADYSFTVVATDVAGNATEQTVSVDINCTWTKLVIRACVPDVAALANTGRLASRQNQSLGSGLFMCMAIFLAANCRSDMSWAR